MKKNAIQASARAEELDAGISNSVSRFSHEWIEEWRQNAAGGDHHERSQSQQEDDQWQQPPPLLLSKKQTKLFEQCPHRSIASYLTATTMARPGCPSRAIHILGGRSRSAGSPACCFADCESAR